MKTGVKATVVAACVLLTAGLILLFVSLSAYGFSMERLYKSQLGRGEDISGSEDFSGSRDIYVDGKACNVELTLSDDDLLHIGYTGGESEKITLTDDGETIRLTQGDAEAPWYIHLFRYELNSTVDITISVPESYTGTVNLVIASGNVSMSDVSLRGILQISLTTGNVDIWNTSVDTALIAIVAGDVDLTDLVCTDRISVDLTTGDADLKTITTSRIVCSTTTGRQEITDVTVLDISLFSTTGDVILSGLNSVSARIETSTGTISGSVSGAESDYTVQTSTETGSDSLSFHRYAGDRTLDITTTTGDIRVSFEAE